MLTAKDTVEFGRQTGTLLRSGSVFALTGELGAGKTQFVKGLAAALGYAEEVTSPTFTLVHEYTGGRVPLYHFDFYRLESAKEAIEIGFDEFLETPGVVAIEWADKFPTLIPAGARWLHFSIRADEAREIRGLP